jgi:DNA-binding FadR family transcriptional regulator
MVQPLKTIRQAEKFLMFTAARPVRAFESIIDQVEKVILQGELSAGDQLPPERQLQTMLGVSRNTLRESLRVLEQKGLIEIRIGNKGGIFVREINSDPMSEGLALFVRSNRISLDQMAEFRQDLEGLVADRAASRVSPENMAELGSLLDQAGGLAREGLEKWNEFIRVDKEIHLALARAAGNPLHHYFLEIVHNNIHWYHVKDYLPRTLEVMELCLRDLKNIVEAVSEGDNRAARSLAREHVMRFNGYMESSQAEPRKEAESGD